MTITAPAAEAVRGAIARLRHLAPNPRKPDHFHEEKSEIVGSLSQVLDFLEGKCRFVPRKDDAPAKPAPRKHKVPHTITDRKGNAVYVDFVNRRRIASENTP